MKDQQQSIGRKLTKKEEGSSKGQGNTAEQPEPVYGITESELEKLLFPGTGYSSDRYSVRNKIAGDVRSRGPIKQQAGA